VKAVINSCKVCDIHKKGMACPDDGKFSKEQVSFTRSFMYTGINYAGFFDIKTDTERACLIIRDMTMEKPWSALPPCFPETFCKPLKSL